MSTPSIVFFSKDICQISATTCRSGEAIEKMGDVLEQLLASWVPLSAAVLRTAMAFAPMEDVQRCRRNKSLGKVGTPPLDVLLQCGDCESDGWG